MRECRYFQLHEKRLAWKQLIIFMILFWKTSFQGEILSLHVLHLTVRGFLGVSDLSSLSHVGMNEVMSFG